MLLIINSVFIAQAVLVAIIIRKQRASGSHVSSVNYVPENNKLQQQHASRGWALMELMLVGAALLYSIVSSRSLLHQHILSCRR